MAIYQRFIRTKDGKRKKGNWYYDFVYKGQRYVGCIGSVSRTVAKEEETRKKTAVIEGHLNPAKVRKSPRFDAFAQKYLEWMKANRKPLTHRRACFVFVLLVGHFGARGLNEITAWEIERYKKARRDMGKAPATVNLELRFLRSALHKAYDWKQLGKPPERSVKLLKTPEGKVRFLSEDEEAALLAVASPALRRIVTAGLLTGFRRGELSALKTEAVDLVRGILTLEACDSKNGERRTLPISDRLQAVFQEALSADRQALAEPHEHAVVFTKDDGTPWTGSSLSNAFGRLCQKAGIEILYPHVLRHTFASRLVMAGVDLRTVQELMGHKSIHMTMRYAHLSADHKRGAIEALERRFSGKSPIHFPNTHLTAPIFERQKA
jgi:integrase